MAKNKKKTNNKNLFNKIIRNYKYAFLQTKRFINLIIKNDPEKIAVKTINLGAIVLGIFLSIFIIW